MSLTYRSAYSKKVTPQSQPIPGEDQVENQAGGYVYALDDWKRLERFLILGADGPTYYATEQKMQRENAECVLRCIKEDGPRTVRTIAAMSQSGRAPKNSPAIFALALCAAYGDSGTKGTVYQHFNNIVRIGTHLFEFVEYVDGMRGWGRGLKALIGRWYAEKDPAVLAYQAIKYQQRNGWSHRDLLRLAHRRVSDNGSYGPIFHWIVKGWESVGPEPHPNEALRQVWAFEHLKRTTDAKAAAKLIADYRLPRECVPTALLTDPVVWEALLNDMPMTALLRNLGNLSKCKLLVPFSDAEHAVIAQICDLKRLKKARIHPIAVLSALRTYADGHGVRGKGKWETCHTVCEALQATFYASFATVEPTGKPTLLALDVSGSMTGGTIAGVPGLTPRGASVAMALVTLNVEPNVEIVGFSDTLVRIPLLARGTLNEAIKTVDAIPMGNTDCSLPITWAQKNKHQIEAIQIYTDSETWYGGIHPSQALRAYRQAAGLGTKLSVVGMTSTGFTIADPKDAGMMDVVGFDATAPSVMADFVRG